ncbi:hypothetical protein Ancab_014596 [Ancistrocladus abbreviatus]
MPKSSGSSCAIRDDANISSSVRTWQSEGHLFYINSTWRDLRIDQSASFIEASTATVSSSAEAVRQILASRLNTVIGRISPCGNGKRRQKQQGMHR